MKNRKFENLSLKNSRKNLDESINNLQHITSIEGDFVHQSRNQSKFLNLYFSTWLKRKNSLLYGKHMESLIINLNLRCFFKCKLVKPNNRFRARPQASSGYYCTKSSDRFYGSESNKSNSSLRLPGTFYVLLKIFTFVLFPIILLSVLLPT